MARVVTPKKRTRKKIPHLKMSGRIAHDERIKSRKRKRARGRRVIPANVGRPSLLNKEYYDIAERLAYLGETRKGYAKAFGVDETTIDRWLTDDEGFIRAVKKGGVVADGEVARRLYQRAIGYQHPDVHVSSYMGDVTLTPIRKHYPPDTPAAAMWLRNRRPDLWKTDAQLTQSPSDPDGDDNVLPIRVEIVYKDARLKPIDGQAVEDVAPALTDNLKATT